MGLAPFGKPEFCIEKMRKIVKIDPKRPLEFHKSIYNRCSKEVNQNASWREV